MSRKSQRAASACVLSEVLPAAAAPNVSDADLEVALADFETKYAAFCAAVEHLRSTEAVAALRHVKSQAVVVADEDTPAAVETEQPVAASELVSDSAADELVAADAAAVPDVEQSDAPSDSIADSVSDELMADDVAAEQVVEPAEVLSESVADCVPEAPEPVDFAPVAPGEEAVVELNAAAMVAAGEASSLAGESAHPLPDEDEALLASLSAETANAIRVRRRLTMKSVKDLLAERDPANPDGGAAVNAASAKRPWWRFGR